MFINIKRFHGAVLNDKLLKLKLGVFLEGHTVAMVAHGVVKMITTCLLLLLFTNGWPVFLIHQ